MLNQKLSSISQEDFNFLIKNGKRNSKLFNFDFESLIYLKWGLLKETLPDLFDKNDFEQLFYLMLQDRKQFVFLADVQKIEVNQAMSFILWLIDEMKTIRELESTYLRSDPDVKLLQAGINKLDQFGIKNTLFNLGGKDPEKHKVIRNTPYNEIFDIQYYGVITGEIEKALAKIK